MKITLSIVSHGQRDIALRMLEDILRLSPRTWRKSSTPPTSPNAICPP